MMRHRGAQAAPRQQHAAVDITQFDWGMPFAGEGPCMHKVMATCSAHAHGPHKGCVQSLCLRSRAPLLWRSGCSNLPCAARTACRLVTLGTVAAAGPHKQVHHNGACNATLPLALLADGAACAAGGAAGAPLAVPPRCGSSGEQGSGEEQGLTPQSSAVLSPLAGSDAEGADFWSPRDGSGQHRQSDSGTTPE
jgi:hypothetical protein